MSKIYVEVNVLATYYNDQLVNALAIRDSEADAHAIYRCDLITLDELAVSLVRLYGKGNDEPIGKVLREFLSGQAAHISLNGPAALLPCIGGVRVECQTKYIDWEAA